LFHVLQAITEIPELEINKLSSLFYIDNSGTEFTKSFCLRNEFIAAYSALLFKMLIAKSKLLCLLQRFLSQATGKIILTGL
jgi:hypothetical protein